MVAPLAQKLVDLAHASLAECDIAHREGFIHDQDFGIDMGGHRECEPQDHAGGICPDGLADEVPDLSEALNGGKSCIDFFTREAEQRPIEINVVAAGEFGRKTGAQFQQRREPSMDLDRSEVGVSMPATIWSRVLLPQPFAPMMPNASPRATEKVTSRRAHKPSCGA